VAVVIGPLIVAAAGRRVRVVMYKIRARVLHCF
jgi:hypothetical protein